MKATWIALCSAGCVLWFAAGSTADDRPSLRVVAADGGYWFTEGDTKVLFYQRKPKSLDGKYPRANYVHPLYDLDGNVLTEDFPKGHRHHRGIFWAWHQMWVGDKKIGDPWACRDFVWDVQEARVIPPSTNQAAMRVRVLWKSPKWTDETKRPKPLVDERTVIRVHRATADTRKIDFEIRLLALQPNVRIGGSEDAKGYGGFSTRIRLPNDIEFTGHQGSVEPQHGAVEAGPWMDFSGTFGKSTRKSGLTILCHPSLPGYPQGWILRRSHSMQNPAYPGREAVALSQKKPTVFRYRIVLHRRVESKDTIDAWHAEYAKTSLK